MDDYRERIAAVQHEIWSHWMRYLFSVCPPDSFGNGIIPAERAQRWQRQMNTDYADLTDKERESDRDQADKVLAERDAEIAALKAELADSQSDVAQLLTTVEQQRQYIERLHQQVAELQAWKDAVPVKSILWYFDVSEFSQAIVNYNTVTQMKHNTALEKWHRDMVEKVIDV